MNTYKKGREYEMCASKFLESKGYRILEHNFSPLNKFEVDIIAQDADCIVAVEVKGIDSPWAEDYIWRKVNLKKRAKIIRALEIYATRCADCFKYMRLDVVLIFGNRIVHYKDVQ